MTQLRYSRISYNILCINVFNECHLYDNVGRAIWIPPTLSKALFGKRKFRWTSINEFVRATNILIRSFGRHKSRLWGAVRTKLSHVLRRITAKFLSGLHKSSRWNRFQFVLIKLLRSFVGFIHLSSQTKSGDMKNLKLYGIPRQP